jgi:hypothetical protein
MAELSQDAIDILKRMTLEAESLIDCIERDPGTNMRWMGSEYESLKEGIEEAREVLWGE